MATDVGSVTAKVDETGTVGDLYIDTTISIVDLRLGKVDGVNGNESINYCCRCNCVSISTIRC